jgi:hypothetical protein
VIGLSFAQYRLIAAIGAGGMGEVYRATAGRSMSSIWRRDCTEDLSAGPQCYGRRNRFRLLDG